MQWFHWWHHQHHHVTGNILLPCTCQKLICPSNGTYKPHLQISSCAHRRQLCQYICFIQTYCNQQYDHKHWYTYISHYWHMSLNKYTSHTMHVCPTVQLLWFAYRPYIIAHTSPKKKQQQQTINYHSIAIYVLTTSMTFKYQIYMIYAN